MSDEELRALERQVAAAPDDEALRTRYERALVRAGRAEEVVQVRLSRLTCDKRWVEHDTDPRSGRVRWCRRCERGVRFVRDGAELERYARAGQPVAGERALLEAHVRAAVAGLPTEAPSPAGLPCFADARPDEDNPDVVGLRVSCRCLAPPARTETRLHEELQDTSSEAWRALLQLVDEAARDGRTTFSPREELGPERFCQLVTLPPTIAKLKEVRRLDLYGSSLVRLPPEIGEMASLADFDPYTSYKLHWFPYELTRCRFLRQSRVSTRALYGNHNHRPPFPLLKRTHGVGATSACSVCARPSTRLRQYWITLRVATDALPLLLSSCSKACLDAVPTPGEGFVQRAHRGGTGLVQPPPRY